MHRRGEQEEEAEDGKCVSVDSTQEERKRVTVHPPTRFVWHGLEVIEV